nr:unnamed protein product [Spirometra erinaceieuropaei]
MEKNNALGIPPSISDIIKAVLQISNRTAPGSDAMPDEIQMDGSPRLMDKLTSLFQELSRTGQFQPDFKYATTVHLYKRKGNRQLCDNQRHLITQNRRRDPHSRSPQPSTPHVEQGLLQESQHAFRSSRRTTDTASAAKR